MLSLLSYPAVKNSINNMAPQSISTEDRFNDLFMNVKKFSRIIGVDVLDENFRPTFRTVLSCAVITNGFFMALYSMWLERNDMLKLVEIVPVLMLILQAFHKLMLRITVPADYRALYGKTCHIFELLHANQANRELMYGSLQTTWILQRLLQIMYSAVVITISSIPVILFLVTGNKMLAIPLYFPGVDESTMIGFCVLVAIHQTQMFFAVCGYLAVDCQFLALVVPISGYANAFRNEIEKLNSLLDQHYQEKEEEANIFEQFTHVCKLHQMLIEYEEMFEQHYVIPNLTKIASIVVGMISNIFLVFRGDFLQAYLLLAGFFAQLTQYCSMGTVLTVNVLML